MATTRQPLVTLNNIVGDISKQRIPGYGHANYYGYNVNMDPFSNYDYSSSTPITYGYLGGSHSEYTGYSGNRISGDGGYSRSHSGYGVGGSRLANYLTGRHSRYPSGRSQSGIFGYVGRRTGQNSRHTYNG